MAMPGSDTKSLKELEEIERLRLENTQLRRPWRSPAFVIAAAGLVLSVLGNVQQYVSATNARAEAADKLTFEREKWDTERQKLALEVEELKGRSETSAADREAIQSELNQIEHDIKIYDDEIFGYTTKLTAAKDQLKRYEMEKRQAKAEAQANIISTLDNALKYFQSEREQLVARRSELEKRLPR